MAHKMAHFGSQWPKNQKLQLRFRQTCANASWSARHGHGNTGKWKYSRASEHEPGCRLRPGLSRFSSGRRSRANPKITKITKIKRITVQDNPPPPPRRPTPNPPPPALRASALTPACGQPLRQPKRERDVDPDFHRGDGVGPTQKSPKSPKSNESQFKQSQFKTDTPALDTPRRHRLYSLLVPLRHPRRSIAPFSHPRCLAAFRARRGGRFRDSFQVPGQITARIRPDSLPNLSRGSCVG